MSELTRVIVMGGSTGAMDGFRTIVAGLPSNLPAAVLIAHHIPSEGPNLLADILQRSGPLPASTARENEPVRAGHIYVAPADHHLLVGAGDRMHITQGPKENRARPAIDALFRSAAAVYGRRAVGVLLSGMLDDGTAGLWAIRERGGVTIVQNPEQASAPSMPLSALKHVEVNQCLAVDRIAPLLVELAQRVVPIGSEPEPTPAMETEVRIAAEHNALESGIMKWGQPSVFSCPECHGVLLQLREGTHIRFRCHTGHAFAQESLLAETIARTEEALWNALRAFDETVILLGRIAAEAETTGNPQAAADLRARSSKTESRANALRQILREREEIGGTASA